MNILRVNYVLVIAEGLFGYFIGYRIYNAVSVELLLIVVFGCLIPNFLLHIFLFFNSSKALLDFGLIVFLLFINISITAVVNFFPDARPSFMLIYIPGIIFSSSQSLSLGVTNLITVLTVFGVLTYLEMHGHKLLLSQAVDYSNMSISWKLGVYTTFFFLIILSFLSFYVSAALRNKAKKISELAELNKRLYQKSKTTSDEIVASMRESLVVVDEKLKIVQYNKAFQKLVGESAPLINELLSSVNVKIIKSLSSHLADIASKKVDAMRFTIKDSFFHKYDINISPIDLQDKEAGYVILISENSIPWGSVFSTKNGMPVELAVIRLMRVADKKIVETKVTDQEGRFSLVVAPGSYLLTVIKDGFEFPSKKIKEGYHGEKIDVTSASDSLIKINIPIDPKA